MFCNWSVRLKSGWFLRVTTIKVSTTCLPVKKLKLTIKVLLVLFVWITDYFLSFSFIKILLLSFRTNFPIYKMRRHVFLYTSRFYNERKADARLDSCLNMAHPIRAFYIIHRIYKDWSTVINSLNGNKTIAYQPMVSGRVI